MTQADLDLFAALSDELYWHGPTHNATVTAIREGGPPRIASLHISLEALAMPPDLILRLERCVAIHVDRAFR